MIRRNFLNIVSKASLGLAGMPLVSWLEKHDITKVSILHTNDMHSRINPFPMNGGKYQGLGGIAKRSSLIQQIRKQEEHVLLLDSGDIFQGTPYFNFYGGELEFKSMSHMDYDAATIGNHDFDGGMDGLKKQLVHANFDIINANYNFNDTLLKDKFKPYKIFVKDQIRIGVFGIGIELDGLVPETLRKDVQFNDPIKVSNKIAQVLKNDENCDFIICLSHLGFAYKQNDLISDIKLAQNSKNIDLILGGHTHTFLEQLHFEANLNSKPVAINQAGWAGIMLGKVDLYFEKNRKNQCKTCKNLTVK